jgi:type VI secretion system secreted protein Hcp
MAVDMFLTLEPVKGESQDKTYKDKIDVLAWSWGMSNSGTAHLGKGAGAGKVNVNDISLTKYIDASSPDLMKSCCNGKHFGEGKLIVRKAGEKPVEYLVVTMTDVLVTSVSTGGSGGEDRLTENVSLNFAKVNVKYTPQEQTGAGGAVAEMTWNIATGSDS